MIVRFCAADTSVLVAFSAIRRLDIVRSLYSRVLIPEAVRRELVDQGQGWIEAAQAQEAINAGEWITVEHVDPAADLPKTREGLFSGEAEVIPLAKRHGCPVLLDDLAARKAADRAGLEVVGSLGLLISAKRNGLIDGIAPLIEGMRTAGIRFAQPLIERALREVGEM